MSTIRAVRELAIYENADNGYGIYRCRTDEFDSIVVKGYDIPVAGSCWVIMSGNWIEDATYGHQFNVQSCEVEKPKSEKGLVDYLGSLKIGLGKTRAKAVYHKFGERVWDVLDNDPDRIREIPVIPEKVASKFVEVHLETTAIRDLLQVFSFAPEFTTKQASKVVKALKGSAVDAAKKNPYILCRYTDLGFSAVDRMVSRMESIPETFPPRMTSAIYTVLWHYELAGHTCLPADVLGKRVLKLLNAQGRKPVTENILVNHMAEMLQKKQLYKSHGMIFLRHRFREECLLARGIVRLMSSTATDATFAQLVIDEVLKEYMKENKIQFASSQKDAILSAFLHPVSIVTGGPGTGKTTLTKAILAMDKFISGNRSNPLLLAPTGRAAKRLSEATGHPAQTVHSAIEFLGEKETPEELAPQYKEGVFSDASLVIVDECSMLDQMIASWLIQLIPEGMRVIFIGDSDQLPSVGAGNVLRELIKSEVVPVTRLSVIFRQKGENLIVTNAAKIHNGQHDLEYGKQFKAINVQSEEGQLYSAVKFYLQCYNHYGPDSIMMLCPYKSTKKTIVNTVELNRQIQHKVKCVRKGRVTPAHGTVEIPP